MNPSTKTYYQSPVGQLEIVVTNNLLTSIGFIDSPGQLVADSESNPVSKQYMIALDNYFAKTPNPTKLPLTFDGTPFQKRVWLALADLPFGTTCSYADIARTIGQPMAVRAVATAISKNPVLILIPCHRVIGVTGKLTGYSGELWRKEWLLNHEKNSKI